MKKKGLNACERRAQMTRWQSGDAYNTRKKYNRSKLTGGDIEVVFLGIWSQAIEDDKAVHLEGFLPWFS